MKNAGYAAMVESVDDCMGRILDTLDRLGIRDRTAIVFTSDNGGLVNVTDNKPARAGKGSACEGGVRVHFYEDGCDELYDLVKDPGDTTDLAAKEPARAAELKSTLDVWLTAVGAQFPTPNPNADPARDQPVSRRR